MMISDLTQKEDHLQGEIESYLALCGLMPYDWMHIPKSAYRAAKSSPTRKGRRDVKFYLGDRPDLIIFKRKNGAVVGTLFLELKTKTGKIQDGQKLWAAHWTCTRLARSFDDAKAIIDEFLK